MQLPETTTAPHKVQQKRLGKPGIWFHILSAFFGIYFIYLFAPLLGPTATFIGFDTILAFYLFSLFNGKIRYLFLLHPLFVLVSSFLFGMPYDQIGSSYTYLFNVNKFIDPDTLVINTPLLIATFITNLWSMGRGGVYLGTLYIILFPRYLFDEVPAIVNYYSLSTFTMLYATIGVTAGIMLGSIRKELLLVIALYTTVAPTFLEINSSLHRYGLMVLGLWLFIEGYMGFLHFFSVKRKIILLMTIVTGLALVFVSKPALLLSMALFMILERFSANQLPFISKLFVKSKRHYQILLLLAGLVLFQLTGQLVGPGEYTKGASQGGAGGQFLGIANLPAIGIILRLLYAALSPFPWLGFDQWDIYGYNGLFLVLHLFSSLLAIWMLMSLIRRLPAIVNDDDEIRVLAMFGISLLLSLTFSAIGFHVYLAPALPFLSVVLLRRRTRTPWHHAAGFVIFLEVLAQISRFAK